MARDYYQVLGVPRRASPREIKAAYRRLARKHHPDVTGDDPHSTERFKEITEAYECLGDPKRRRAYDLFGHPQSESGPGFGDTFTGFTDFVQDIFKGSEAPAEPGVDVEVDVLVTFLEAWEGVQKVVQAELVRPCSDCDGRGHPEDAKEGPCPDCDGSGKVQAVGPLPFKRACSRCDGSGKLREKVCRSCRGKGQRREKERLKVTIPAGVDTGSRLRLKGRGSAGTKGAPPGDLYVRVTVGEDERFEREDDDLLTQVRVSFTTALLGGSVDVPLPVGSARMKIPGGTQGGQVFRLRDKGFASLSGADRGALLVTIQLSVPKEVPDAARQRIEELKALLPDL
jgi:molecular chaperone DnaJ